MERTLTHKRGNGFYLLRFFSPLIVCVHSLSCCDSRGQSLDMLPQGLHLPALNGGLRRKGLWNKPGRAQFESLLLGPSMDSSHGMSPK